MGLSDPVIEELSNQQALNEFAEPVDINRLSYIGIEAGGLGSRAKVGLLVGRNGDDRNSSSPPVARIFSVAAKPSMIGNERSMRIMSGRSWSAISTAFLPSSASTTR